MGRMLKRFGLGNASQRGADGRRGGGGNAATARDLERGSSLQPQRLRKDVAAAVFRSPGGTGALAARGEKGSADVEELLKLLRFIEDDCLPKEEEKRKGGGKGDEEEDEFTALKVQIYSTIRSTRELILRRRTLREEKGNSLETIRIGSRIQDEIAATKQLFQQLSEVYARQCQRARSKKSSAKKKVLSPEELEERYREIAVVKRQIDDVRQAYRESERLGGGGWDGDGGGGADLNLRTITELRSDVVERRDAADFGSAGGGPSQWEGVVESTSAEDEETIRKWRERDGEFDRQLEEIGGAIDRIGESALQMRDKIEQQHVIVEQLDEQADRATDEMTYINNRIKEVMKSQSGASFCCRLLLVAILLVLICFVFATVYNRYLRR